MDNLPFHRDHSKAVDLNSCPSKELASQLLVPMSRQVFLPQDHSSAVLLVLQRCIYPTLHRLLMHHGQALIFIEFMIEPRRMIAIMLVMMRGIIIMMRLLLVYGYGRVQ